LVAGLVALIFASPSAFAQSAHEPKIDRGLEESLRNGAPTQSLIITVKAGHRGDNIVWGSVVPKGRLF
jgi:hypothetical protein